MEATRAAAIQSAKDLYRDAAVKGITDAFNAVGLDGTANPPSTSYGGGCLAVTALTGSGTQGLDADGEGANQIRATMYRVRDQIMTQDSAGQHYSLQYDDITGLASQLLVDDPALRQEAAGLLQDLAPPLTSLAGGDGDEATMTPHLADEMTGFLDHLEKADIPSLKGMTFDKVLDQLDNRVEQASGPIGDTPTGEPPASAPTPSQP